MSAEISIRPLLAPEDHERAYDLQAEVWSASTSVPSNFTIALQRHGGVVLGAFAPGGALVGVVFGFTSPTHIPGARNGLSHHSHVAAVRPDFRGRGIGEMLKRAQRAAVLAQGINLMTWTFDPLEARNAYFNLHKLGAIARTFIVDCYGPMNDALNAGLPSDRFEAEWWLEGGSAFRTNLSALTVEVPRDFQALKRQDIQAAWRWRMETRARFQQLMAEGYAAVDLEVEGDGARYRFARGAQGI